MKFTQKISSFVALLLLATAFNAHKTHTMEPEDIKKVGWVALAGAAIVGGYAAYQQFLSYIQTEQEQPIIHVMQEQPIEPFPFTELPKDIQNTIISLLTINTSATTLKEAAQAINSLAQVNKELNTLINEPQFCLQIIKSLALKFKCTDEQAAAALKTQEAKKRLEVQKKLLSMFKDFKNEEEFNLFYEKYKEYIDVKFKYIHANLLRIATERYNCFLIKILVDNGVDINQLVVFNRLTPLMHAANTSPNLILCILGVPKIAINQQDKYGRTALMYAIQSRIVVDYKQRIQLLLDAGADPEIDTHKGITPLIAAQAKGDQEIIDLIQEAINKKHKQQGK